MVVIIKTRPYKRGNVVVVISPGALHVENPSGHRSKEEIKAGVQERDVGEVAPEEGEKRKKEGF